MNREHPGKTLERWLEGLLRHLMALMLFALMLLTCVDVLGRYFFNHPVYGGLELTEIILAGTIFSALPIVTWRGDHIVVGLIELPQGWLRRVQDFTTSMIGAVALAVLSRQLWLRAERLEKAGETTIQIKIPVDLVAYSISVLMAVTALAFLVRAFVPGTPADPTSEIRE